MKEYILCAGRNMITLLLYAMMAFMLFAPSGCKPKGSDPEPVSDVQLAKLTKTWKLKDATLDGVSKASDYSSFQLTLSGTKGATTFSYSTSGRPARSPWPASGSWSFGADPSTQIIRDPMAPDQLNVTYTVSQTTLQLSFPFTGTAYSGRSAIVTGQWVFTFE
jgi:hypothetical protein